MYYQLGKHEQTNLFCAFWDWWIKSPDLWNNLCSVDDARPRNIRSLFCEINPGQTNVTASDQGPYIVQLLCRGVALPGWDRCIVNQLPLIAGQRDVTSFSVMQPTRYCMCSLLLICTNTWEFAAPINQYSPPFCHHQFKVRQNYEQNSLVNKLRDCVIVRQPGYWCPPTCGLHLESISLSSGIVHGVNLNLCTVWTMTGKAYPLWLDWVPDTASSKAN